MTNREFLARAHPAAAGWVTQNDLLTIVADFGAAVYRVNWD
jgi:hypothetical protein